MFSINLKGIFDAVDGFGHQHWGFLLVVLVVATVAEKYLHVALNVIIAITAHNSATAIDSSYSKKSSGAAGMTDRLRLYVQQRRRPWNGSGIASEKGHITTS